MIHEVQTTNDRSEKTTNVWYNCIKFGKCTSEDMLTSCLPEHKMRIPAISHFLSRNSRRQHDKSSLLHSFISIRQYTMIGLNLIIRDEDFISRSQLIPKVYVIFIRHIVTYRLFSTWTNKSIHIVYWKMYLICQPSSYFCLISTRSIGVEGSTVQDRYL